MSCINSNILAGASGAGGDKVYVDDVFSTTLWKGTWGGTNSALTINNGIDLTGEGGLVWTKHRNYTNHHQLYDTERGAGKPLYSSNSNGEGNNPAFTSFNSNGFSLAAGSSNLEALNGGTSQEYTSWTFRKAPGFFDVIKYTGNGNSNRQISHALGSTPGMVVVKRLDLSENWTVQHRSFPGNSFYLNDTFGTPGGDTSNGEWNNTAPTSSVFTVGNADKTNRNGSTYVAYIFAHDDAQFGTGGDESIIKCGSYTGNGSATGPVINLGFEPQFLIVKQTSQTGANWVMVDTMRGMSADGVDQQLYANINHAENIITRLAPLANGFQPRFAGYEVNASGQTYIYMAIRRPNKPLDAFDPPLDATDVFAMGTAGGTSPTPPWFTSGFVTDFFIRKQINSTQSPSLYSRIQGPESLYTTMTSGESGGSSYTWDFMDGFSKITSIDAQIHGYLFKRAPGFMDVVAYEGAGGGTTNNVNHNLGVAPEMIIVKNRGAVSGWPVYHSATGLSRSARLQSTSMDANASGYWASAPTSTQFSPKGSDTNNTGSWIAYLFATLPGVSKVGSYSGNSGYAVNVPCGFTNGARFILIKRDGTGDWYVWDTFRGIASGNDPYWLVNSETAEVTNTDYVDPLSTGFTVTASAPAALNASGGTYLFLAIA